MDGLGLNVERPKRKPVPLSPQYSNISQQSTPGLRSNFASPDFFSHNTHDSDVELLTARQRNVEFPTKCDASRSWTWVTIFMCSLAFYSFCFSGVFLGIALAKPRWGRKIGGSGSLSYSSATLLSALFSKTVELSFVAVLVATLGQILSRRAINKRAGKNGITVAEMTMRSWILQPGLIFTHADAVRYAGPTLLGALVLVATLAATFYTTAAEALASPKLKFGGWEDRWLVGLVDSAFANVTYLTKSCNTPITNDPEAGGSCLQIEYAGQSYHNLQGFLANWTVALGGGSGNTSYSWRPKPNAMLSDNTTVIGQWITGGADIMRDSQDRLVQNISMAMPHANLFNAARNAANGIAQPFEVFGQGEYFVVAAVPAPTLNVVCASLDSEEVKPFIYDTNQTTPQSTGPTALDDIFDFGDFFTDKKNPAPLFPHLPIIYNTVNNNSLVWGPPAVYLLSTPPPQANVDHVLCSIKITQYPNCTTKYHVAEAGGELSVYCDDDPGNTMPYSKTNDFVVGKYDSNWQNIGSEWLKANALSHGVTDSNASIARIITQLTPRFEAGATSLDPQRPSIAEALAVLAGSTTVMSSLHAPFNQTDRSPGPPTEDRFKASVMYKDYASGGSENWQGIFYVVLFVVFLINLFSLIYQLKHLFTDGEVMDFLEPQNLFALAFMSPPGQRLSSTKGSEPSGTAFARRFTVDLGNPASDTGDQPQFYVRSIDDGDVKDQRMLNRRSRMSTLTDWRRSGEWLSLDQYRRLAG